MELVHHFQLQNTNFMGKKSQHMGLEQHEGKETEYSFWGEQFL